MFLLTIVLAIVIAYFIICFFAEILTFLAYAAMFFVGLCIAGVSLLWLLH
jgi:hypothetical protein